MTTALKKKRSSSNAAVGGDGSTIFTDDPESGGGTEGRRSSVTAGGNGGGLATTETAERGTAYDADEARHAETAGLGLSGKDAAIGAGGIGAAGLAAAAAGRSRSADSLDENQVASRGVGSGETGLVAGDRRHPHDWIVGQGPVTSNTPLPPEDYVFREEEVQAMPTVEGLAGEDYVSGTRGLGSGRRESSMSSGLPEYEPGSPTYADPPEYGQVIETEESGSTSVTQSGSSGRARSNPPQSPHLE